MQRGRTCFHLSLSLLAILALQVRSLQAATIGVVVDDSFADGDRANTGSQQADWWSSNNSSSANSVAAYPNKLRMITGTSGRGIHGTFAPQTLNVGQTIVATYTFTTPATVGTNRSGAFKVALMDFNDPNLANDLESSSSSVNPLYTNFPGYMTDFDVNKTDNSDDIAFREHLTPNTSGRFLGTSSSSEWTSLGSSSDVGYTILANTEYVGVMSITRTGADSVDIFASLSQGGNLLDSDTDEDVSGIANNFGVLGFWANSNTFGSTTTQGENEDNGITFSNIRIEVIPEPSTLALCFGVLALLSGRRKRS